MRVCMCETAPALMEKWSVAQGPALVSSCISHLQCFSCLPFSSPAIVLRVFLQWTVAGAAGPSGAPVVGPATLA